jgi:hypothetical protein
VENDTVGARQPGSEETEWPRRIEENNFGLMPSNGLFDGAQGAGLRSEQGSFRNSLNDHVTVLIELRCARIARSRKHDRATRIEPTPEFVKVDLDSPRFR